MLTRAIELLLNSREGISTQELSKALDLSYQQGLNLRHQFQALCGKANRRLLQEDSMHRCRAHCLEEWKERCRSALNGACWTSGQPCTRKIETRVEMALSGECKLASTTACFQRTKNSTTNCRAGSIQQCNAFDNICPEAQIDISLFQEEDDWVAVANWQPNGRKALQLAPGYPKLHRINLIYLNKNKTSWFQDHPELLATIIAPWGSNITFRFPRNWANTPAHRAMNTIFKIETGCSSAMKTWSTFLQWRNNIINGRDHKENRHLYAQEFVYRINNAGKKASKQLQLLTHE